MLPTRVTGVAQLAARAAMASREEAAAMFDFLTTYAMEASTWTH